MSLSDAAVFSMLSGAARHLLASFRSLTPIQRRSIPAILSRRPALLLAPTAAGKTEAALAPVLELRRREGWQGRPTILHIAPTRALVNDLTRRIEPLLGGYLVVGRRTSEHRSPDADLLFTTPESLDSMLARGTEEQGHLLAQVRVVILDELHLLAGNARGAQLQILLQRLDDITAQPVLRVGLTATLEDPGTLSRRFLGSDAEIIHAGAGRQMLIDRSNGSGPLQPRPDGGVDPLVGELWRVKRDRGDAQPLTDRLLALRSEGPLKALVFVPSRARCDRLVTQLSESLRGRCPVPVLAHHGSLSQSVREATEAQLCTSPESVVVATSTMELGIDIGDVNLVVLDGPPGSTASLLQRVGRANRREGAVRVIPLCGDGREACMLASMLRAAEAGELDPERWSEHLSVVVQQLASILKQAPSGVLPRARLLALLGSSLKTNPEQILTACLGNELLVERTPGFLRAGEPLRELMDSPLQLHSNIGSAGRLVPMTDGLTGEVLAWVPQQQESQVVLAGGAFSVINRGDQLELRAGGEAQSSHAIRYAAKRMPITRDALRHLQRGVGLSENSLVPLRDGWMHFGGALRGTMLTLGGLESTPVWSAADPRGLPTSTFDEVLARSWRSLESLCSFGPHQRLLPEELRAASVVATCESDGMTPWLQSLEEATPSPEQMEILNDV